MTVKAIEVFGDEFTKESAESKAMEFGLALLEGGLVHLEKGKQAKLFQKWLIHCGIPYRVIETALPSYQGRFAERISLALLVATVGRKALNID